MKALRCLRRGSVHFVLRSRSLGAGPGRALWMLALVGFMVPLIGLGRQGPAQWQSLQASTALQRFERDALRLRLAQAQQGVAAMQAQVDAWPQLDQVPAPPDALALHRLALEHGLRIERLKPGPSEAQSTAAGVAATAARPWTLQVRGSYPALLAYLEALAQTGPAWRLQQLQWSAGGRELHRLQLLLEALPPSRWMLVESMVAARLDAPDPFGLPSEERVPRPPITADEALQARSGPPLSADPLADFPQNWRSELERSRGPLEAIALKEAALTGTVRQGQVWLALVRVGSLIHTLAVGDYIGPDLGRVITIDETGLELREIRRDAQGRWQEQLRSWPVGGMP